MDKNPKNLGKYQIQGVLGEGGMGIVYRGVDPLLDRLVAIKTIRENLLEGNTGQMLLQRFRREAQAEGRLIHPNIIAIYEYQEDEAGMPFFVMEYVEGKSLKEYLARGMHFNLEKSVVIVEQILVALAYSHKKGIIHRDIKPANIILLEDDTIKIADFGISKIEGSEFTQTGQIMGTPQYISPEQRLGKKTDGRSDLYSVGAVLYELLTGLKAMPGKSFSTSPGDREKEEEPTRLDTKDPATMRIYKHVVLKALAKDPEDRFQDADEFVAALREHQLKPRSAQQSRNRGLWFGGALGVVVLLAAFLLSDPNRSENGLPSPDGQVRVPRTTPVTTMEQEKIDQFVKIAKTHVLVGRLILPEGSNAYHSYDMALDIDPANAAAQAGMQELQEKIISQAQSLIEDGRVDDAKTQLAIAVTRFPANNELRELREQVASR